jgi:phosphoribosylanthranilate isomerase
MTKVKCCGITNLNDALRAVELGADAIGFVFSKSPRKISPIKVKKIIKKLPPWISTVGVFVNEDIGTVRRTAEQCNLDWIQLHGEESPSYCRSLNKKIIKVIKNNIEIIPNYNVAGILLDTFVTNVPGGTGKTYDWALAVKAKKYGKPIILAGGLTSKNVKKAIKIVSPYGVDVSSGIEKNKGKKDYKKMKDFIKQVRGCQA